MRRNMYGEPLTRRHWLRPKWYVQDAGAGWELGSAHPRPTLMPDEGHPNCTDCGEVCGTSGRVYYALPSGPSCKPCRDVRWPYVAPPAWKRPLRAVARRTIWPLGSAVDQLYWWHCKRFGKRVIL